MRSNFLFQIASLKGDQSRELKFYADQEKKFPLGYTLYFGPTKALLRIHHPKIIKEILQTSRKKNVK